MAGKIKAGGKLQPEDAGQEAAKRTKAMEELMKQGTTLGDVAEAQELPENHEDACQEAAEKTKAKEELLKQGTTLEDVSEVQELPDDHEDAY